LFAPGNGFFFNGLAEVLAGGVDLLALHGPFQGHANIVGGQHVDDDLRIADAPNSVNPGAQAKADVFGLEGFTLVGQPSDLNQRLNAENARSRQ
jgi:hypothetical protein